MKVLQQQIFCSPVGTFEPTSKPTEKTNQIYTTQTKLYKPKKEERNELLSPIKFCTV